jgi:hypothetical protein
VAVRQGILPEVARTETRARFVDAVRERPIDVAGLSAFRHFDYGFVFYWRRPVPVESELTPLATAPRYLVVSEAEWDRVPPERRATYEPIPGLASGRAGHRARLAIVQRVGGPASGGEGGSR